MPRCVRCDHLQSAHEPGGPCQWHFSDPDGGDNAQNCCTCSGFEPRDRLQRVAQLTLEGDPLEDMERELEEARVLSDYVVRLEKALAVAKAQVDAMGFRLAAVTRRGGYHGERVRCRVCGGEGTERHVADGGASVCTVACDECGIEVRDWSIPEAWRLWDLVMAGEREAP